jgi:hypothetical protein
MNISNNEQIEIWKYELALAMSNEQWHQALNFCGKLRYALRQLKLSDSEIMNDHHRAKEAQAKQIILEKSTNKKHQLQQTLTMRHIRFGEWEQALDSIEASYQDGANRKETIVLLREIEMRTQTFFSPNHRKTNPLSAAIGKRFDEIVNRIGGGSLENWNKLHF